MASSHARGVFLSSEKGCAIFPTPGGVSARKHPKLTKSSPRPGVSRKYGGRLNSSHLPTPGVFPLKPDIADVIFPTPVGCFLLSKKEKNLSSHARGVFLLLPSCELISHARGVFLAQDRRIRNDLPTPVCFRWLACPSHLPTPVGCLKRLLNADKSSHARGVSLFPLCSAGSSPLSSHARGVFLAAHNLPVRSSPRPWVFHTTHDIQ